MRVSLRSVPTSSTFCAPAIRLTFLLALALFTSNCKGPVVSPRREEDRRQLTRDIENAIEATGGSQVWIKSPVALAVRQPEAALEVRVGAEAYSTVMAAVKHEAEQNRLQCVLNESRTKGGMRVADIRLRHNGKLVSRWKLQEVHRILHAAIIIDDLGNNLETARKFIALPYSLTFSVLPHLRDSVETADEACRAGREVMLHLPMQPEAASHALPGVGEIRMGMSSLEVEHVMESDLSSVPHAAGVNNHMGSRATADPRLMAALMRSLAGRHLFFIDSRTTAASVALEAARREGLPSFYRSVFLDNTETLPYTLGQLREFRRVLEEQGAALAIGHPYPTTIAALAQFLPELENDDVQLSSASRLLRLPEVASLKPPSPQKGAE